MNSVERVVYYATEIGEEAPHELPVSKPATSWPADGQISLNNISLSYRPGLPAVLKGTSGIYIYRTYLQLFLGITMSISGGEKVGIVGRYVVR